MTHKPLVVPVSIRIPKALELKLRSVLVNENGLGYRANTDLTKALESALGCSIKNLDFFLPEQSSEPADRKPPALTPIKPTPELNLNPPSTAPTLKPCLQPPIDVPRSLTKNDFTAFSSGLNGSSSGIRSSSSSGLGTASDQTGSTSAISGPASIRSTSSSCSNKTSAQTCVRSSSSSDLTSLGAFGSSGPNKSPGQSSFRTTSSSDQSGPASIRSTSPCGPTSSASSSTYCPSKSSSLSSQGSTRSTVPADRTWVCSTQPLPSDDRRSLPSSSSSSHQSFHGFASVETSPRPRQASGLERDVDQSSSSRQDGPPSNGQVGQSSFKWS